MTIRKPASEREKALRLAIHKIERGRSITGAVRLTFSAVAKEAGVSAALIHNHYPTVAGLIRAKQAKSSRTTLNLKQQQLKATKARHKELLAELKDAHRRIAQLASINETLQLELEALRNDRVAGEKVVSIRQGWARPPGE